tara:strand:+ start:1489 stop:1938 length:450 start_codon:yes stop_codon:yes gene_type:complete
MKQAKQIVKFRAIVRILGDEKDKFIKQLNHLNQIIHTKTQSVQRIIDYKNDYRNGKNIKSCLEVPTLIINMDLFIAKLDEAIYQERSNIECCGKEREACLLKIKLVEDKIDAIEKKMSQIGKKLKVMEMELESNELDELTVQSRMRQER